MLKLYCFKRHACQSVHESRADASINNSISFLHHDCEHVISRDLVQLPAAGFAHRHVCEASHTATHDYHSESNMHMHSYNRGDYEQSDSNESDLHDDEFQLHEFNSIPWAI